MVDAKHAEAQAAKVLRIKERDGYAEQVEFYLDISAGDWSTTRELVVTDLSIDIADLLRRIAQGEFSITQPEVIESAIMLKEGEREYVVAFWRDNGDSCGHAEVDAIHAQGEDGEVDVMQYDPEGLKIEVVSEDESGKVQKQQPPYVLSDDGIAFTRPCSFSYDELRKFLA